MLAYRPESFSFSPFSPWIRTWTVGAQNVRGLPLRNWKARSESNELAWVRFVYLCHFSVPLRIGKITFFEESGTSFSGGWALWRGLSWSNPQFGQMFSLFSFCFMEVSFVLFPFESMGSYPLQSVYRTLIRYERLFLLCRLLGGQC